MPGGWAIAIEEVIEGERTGYQPSAPRTVFWEEVVESSDLPELLMPITVTRCIYMASASRDFSPQHHHREYAQQRSKNKDMFLGTHFNTGMISRYMTDWGGPRSRVRWIKISMGRSICAGDDMIITGRVARKYVDEGEHLVDLEMLVATQEGPAYRCGGTLALPSRGGADPWVPSDRSV